MRMHATRQALGLGLHRSLDAGGVLAAKAEVERYEALADALLPFVRGAEAFDKSEDTYGDDPVFERRANNAVWSFTIADVRVAAEALAAVRAHQPGDEGER